MEPLFRPGFELVPQGKVLILNDIEYSVADRSGFVEAARKAGCEVLKADPIPPIKVRDWREAVRCETLTLPNPKPRESIVQMMERLQAPKSSSGA